ncbi:MAG: OmpA family protein [Deltaproteobacteria bacterium]|nr:OmpA family protein [Deltaproteobacteria bacterium]
MTLPKKIVRGVLLFTTTVALVACAPVRPALLAPAPTDANDELVAAREDVAEAYDNCSDEYVTNQQPWQIWAASGAGVALVGAAGGATAVAFFSSDQTLTGLSVLALSTVAVGSAGAAAFFGAAIPPAIEQSYVQEQALKIAAEKTNHALSTKDASMLRTTGSELIEDCRAIRSSSGAQGAAVLLEDFNAYRAKVELAEDATAKKEEEVKRLEDKRRILQADIKKVEAELKKAGGSNEDLNARIEDLEGISAEKETQLGALRGQVNDLEDAQAALSKEQKKLLDEKRKLEAKNDHFEEVENALKSQIKDKKLALRRLRNGVVVEMQNNVLFPSGSAKLNEIGKETLVAVAKAIAAIKNRRIRIEGHTDNVPVGKGIPFEDNWELSSARALTVTRYLQENGVDPSRMSAEARSQFAPVTSNRSRKGKAKNRRIEIYLVDPPKGNSSSWKPAG